MLKNKTLTAEYKTDIVVSACIRNGAEVIHSIWYSSFFAEVIFMIFIAFLKSLSSFFFIVHLNGKDKVRHALR
jgi:hypothetical protein